MIAATSTSLAAAGAVGTGCGAAGEAVVAGAAGGVAASAFLPKIASLILPKMLMLGTPSREAAAKGGSVADWRRPIQENERLPTRLRAAIPTPIGAFRSAPQMEKSHEPHGHLAAGGRPRIDGEGTGRSEERRVGKGCEKTG